MAISDAKINHDKIIDELVGHPVELLKYELERRCRKNPNYSLRAFAQSLGVSHTFLSMLLQRKRPFTEKMLNKVGSALSLDPIQTTVLLNSSKSGKKSSKQFTMSIDMFSIISDWFYYGILNLIRLPKFQADPKWIAHRLGISESQSQIAFEKLKSLDFIVETKPGNWHRKNPNIEIDQTSYTAACKKFQGQVLEKAKESLENQGPEERALESFTLVMNSSQIPYARKRLREISKELTEELESLGEADQVYNLGLQIYPITKKRML